MIPIGAIISLAGTAASGIMSAINNRKMQRERDAEYAREQARYQAKANEDPLARSEVRAAVNQYDRDAEQTLNNARAYSAIMGATPEYEAAVQKQLAQGKAQLLSGVTAGASARKDKYDELAEQSRQAQYAEQQKFNESRNATYGALAANAAKAFGSIVDAYAADVPTNTPRYAADVPTNTPSKTYQQIAKENLAKLKKDVTIPTIPQAPGVANVQGRLDTLRNT